MKNDDLGNRMKLYENVETAKRFIPTLPVYARIDGRSFSKFTKDMDKPYDIYMADCMIETTKYLVEQTNASMGYTQSDEISLVWHSEDPKSEIFFSGKVHKMTSQLAALASVKFMQLAQVYWPEKVANKLPTFDARVFSLPNRNEAANCFVWREWDATKNSVSMAAHNIFSHKELQGKKRPEMMDMLMSVGVNWNDYPSLFKRGTYVSKREVETTLSQAQMQKIPEEYRPKYGIVKRNHSTALENVPPITKIENRLGFIFDKEEPILKDGVENTW